MLEALRDRRVLGVSRDPGFAQQMTYLFHAILRSNFDCADTVEAILRTGKDRLAGAVLLMFVSDTDDEMALADLHLLDDLQDPPVVIVLQDEEHEVTARAFLEGADDVVSWPGSLVGLVARICARLGIELDKDTQDFADADWELQTYLSEQAELTIAEAQVMRILYARRGETVSREELSQLIDGRPWQYGDRKFDVHVANIRKKLRTAFGSEFSVATVRTKGYRLATKGAVLPV